MKNSIDQIKQRLSDINLIKFEKAIELLESQNFKISIHDFGDTIDLCDAFEPIANNRIEDELKIYATEWRESSESYRFHVR